MSIKTLGQLADYINKKEDWPLDVDDICEANGWIICKSDSDIAIDKVSNEKLSFTGEGDRVDVFPYRGGARAGAGRPSLYADKKRVQVLITESNVKRLAAHAKSMDVSKSDCLNCILDEFFEKK